MYIQCIQNLKEQHHWY